MKKRLDKKLMKLYLWLGLGYFVIGFIETIHTYRSRPWAILFNNFWGVLYLIPINYLLFEWAVPFVLKKRKSIFYNILLGILFLFAFMIIYSCLSYAWRSLGIQLNIYTSLRVAPPNATAASEMSHTLENQMGYSVGSVFFFGVIRHIVRYLKLKQAEQQLRIEKQAAELNYLRSQTNPHFLFNTLNNIYSLTRDKSDLAPESILKLSKILRFMLYETSGDFISVEKELKIIDDYIALEKLRYDETLLVNFNYDVEDMKQALPPLLLIPLVENAFKHGASETRGRPLVDIHLSIKNRQLTFVVKNSAEQVAVEIKENIGLSNLRRQLELLYTDYNLAVQHGNDVFTATLKINLASHV